MGVEGELGSAVDSTVGSVVGTPVSICSEAGVGVDVGVRVGTRVGVGDGIGVNVAVGIGVGVLVDCVVGVNVGAAVLVGVRRGLISGSQDAHPEPTRMIRRTISVIEDRCECILDFPFHSILADSAGRSVVADRLAGGENLLGELRGLGLRINIAGRRCAFKRDQVMARWNGPVCWMVSGPAIARTGVARCCRVGSV